MRFKVQQKGDNSCWFFQISDEHILKGLPIGVPITAQKLDSDLKHLGDVAVRRHRDGRSIIVDNKVVQFASAGVLLKGTESRIKMGAPATFRRISVEHLKPIAIKRTASVIGGGEQKSPITGKVLSVLAKEGDKVQEGDVLLTIEAMKMENRIQAECSGVIGNIKVSIGNSVSVGETLYTLTPNTEENGK